MMSDDYVRMMRERVEALELSADVRANEVRALRELVANIGEHIQALGHPRIAVAGGDKPFAGICTIQNCEACESVKRIWGMPSATAPLCTHENYSCVKERQEVNALVKAAQRIRKLWEETDGFDPRLCDRSAALPRL